MSEYKVAKGWAAFIYIACIVFIGLLVYVLLLPVCFNTHVDSYGALAVVVSVFIIALIFGMRETAIYKIVVDENSISSRSTFTNRTLRFEDIEGLRRENDYVRLIPKDGSQKKFTVSSYVGGYDELIAYLKERLKDLDKAEEEQEEQEILQNQDYGLTTDERAANLKRARRTAGILNTSSVIIAVCQIFIQPLFDAAFIAALSMPFVAVIVLRTSKGLIHVNAKKATAYPSVYLTFFAIGAVLFARAIMSYHIDAYHNIWVPALVVALILIVVIVAASKEIDLKTSNGISILIGIAVFAFAYGYGSVVTINCRYDRSAVDMLNARIVSKRVSHGRSTTYYLELSPWGRRTGNEEISVSSSLYSRMREGDTAYIYYRPGRFHIPWFVVSDR